MKLFFKSHGAYDSTHFRYISFCEYLFGFFTIQLAWNMNNDLFVSIECDPYPFGTFNSTPAQLEMLEANLLKHESIDFN